MKRVIHIINSKLKKLNQSQFHNYYLSYETNIM